MSVCVHDLYAVVLAVLPLPWPTSFLVFVCVHDLCIVVVVVAAVVVAVVAVCPLPYRGHLSTYFHTMVEGHTKATV